MSDENENENGPENSGETPPVLTHEATQYLDRAKMLLIEDVVYCLEHTVVHDNTVNPYGEGEESWCKATEHRTVYYRGRKGDVDESARGERVAAPMAKTEALTSDERTLVAMLVDREHVRAENAFAELREIIGVGDLAAGDELLELLASARHKLVESSG
jgi:hypothetical protein